MGLSSKSVSSSTVLYAAVPYSSYTFKEKVDFKGKGKRGKMNPKETSIPYPTEMMFTLRNTSYHIYVYGFLFEDR